eukprot:GEMP01070836.1.p1 GENE.GEMP01070836.1~~GEMP01070836.1.p1  ORF type:complete len:114 (-),score=0.74 GEMP01070836.1:651-992(-)
MQFWNYMVCGCLFFPIETCATFLFDHILINRPKNEVTKIGEGNLTCHPSFLKQIERSKKWKSFSECGHEHLIARRTKKTQRKKKTRIGKNCDSRMGELLGLYRFSCLHNTVVR